MTKKSFYLLQIYVTMTKHDGSKGNCFAFNELKII